MSDLQCGECDNCAEGFDPTFCDDYEATESGIYDNDGSDYGY